MPKRSLNPKGNESGKFEQVNRAVDALLSQASPAKLPRVESSLAPLVRLAAELIDSPRPEFKEKLKAEFGSHLRRNKTMPTLAEPRTSTQTLAAPRLTFKDAARASDFYTKAFGAREIFRFETPAGIPHLEMRIGDSMIMLTEEWPEGGRFSAETWGHSPVIMSLRVPDVDSFAQHAVSAGMKMISAPKDQFYGHRDATLADPFGYTWGVFSVTEEMSVEEMHRRFAKMMRGPEGGELASGKTGASPVPRGFRTVTPYLISTNGPAMMEFVKTVFEGEETFRTVGSAGGLHGEMRVGDTMLMIGGGIPGQEFRSTPNKHALHIYVKDADATYQKALAAGAVSLDEPRDEEYGERSASIKDPAGNYWYIATHKGATYTPEGLNTVNPYMHPLRAEPLINFLKRAFEGHEIAKYSSPDGVIQHAVVQVGSSVIEMGEAHGKYEPIPTMFYLYVPDVDNVYRRALAAGAKSVSEPVDQPYGDRSGALKDAFGNTWYIATHIKDVTE